MNQDELEEIASVQFGELLDVTCIWYLIIDSYAVENFTLQ